MTSRRRISLVRLALLMSVFGLLFSAVGWRLYDVAFLRHDWYAQRAAQQAEGGGRAFVRGTISLADQGNRLAVAQNRREPAVYAAGDLISAERRGEYAAKLSAAAGVPPDQLARALAMPAGQSRVIARRLTTEAAGAVRALALPGITVSEQLERVYPAGALAADVVGYFGHGDGGEAGQYGIEAQFDGILAGRGQPRQESVLGHLGSLFAGPGAPEPRDVELTIDRNVQAFVADALGDVLARYDAAGGSIIVQDPRSGRILAMADSPSFDPNGYGSYPVGSFLNGAVQQSFEPGSSFKPFTMALGIDAGVITPSTVFHDDGDVVVDGYTIKNFNERHFGRVTMAEVLEKSINTGTMHAQKLIGNERFLRGLEDFGFGQRTGVDLPGELAGDIGNLHSGRRINFLTASFGQGITVTPLQLAAAYSALANGGRMMRPYVVEAVTDVRGGRTVTEPELVGTPVRESTAKAVSDMLVSVVDKGFDKARIARYDVAGKTGTAQIASPDGGYLEGQYNHSFAGFAPASDPRFTIVIRMDRPQGITFAADSLSPVFKDIALFLLNYLNVPPTR